MFDSVYISYVYYVVVTITTKVENVFIEHN